MRDAGMLGCTRPRNLFMTAITVSKEEGRKLFISAVQQQSMKGSADAEDSIKLARGSAPSCNG